MKVRSMTINSLRVFAAAPVKADDAWGSPAPQPLSSPSADPFGDGSKKDDAWGALSNTADKEQGK